MKVYLVTSITKFAIGKGVSLEIDGIFSTREKAKKFKKDIIEEGFLGTNFEIIEIEVDKEEY